MNCAREEQGTALKLQGETLFVAGAITQMSRNVLSALSKCLDWPTF